ncbi:replicative DNA helicase [Burkholderia metallica]|uniref:replicative DNA helicase n=1 Tax=Burkholderia metallica TaxID=488729 RepID=UPI00157A5AFC|nr:replicative DNA helicase [Burkholderia metallica]NTZ84379.1 replicative DNA helicase [Burkholderia metallica]
MSEQSPSQSTNSISSIEAEQSVLGAILLDSTAYDVAASIISPDDFTTRDNRLIFEAFGAMLVAGVAVDVVTVFDHLQTAGAKIKEPLRYLNELAQSTPGASNVARYAEIVRGRSIRRALSRVGAKLIDLAHNTGGRDIATLIDDAQQSVLALSDSARRNETGFVSLNSVLFQVMERVDELSQRGGGSEITGIPTGFADLDARTTGMQPGEMWIIGGRPSMGKTSLAMNIAENAARLSEKPAMVVSLEMPNEQLGVRLVASAGRLNQHRFRIGKIADDEWPRVTHAVTQLSNTPIYLLEESILTPSALRTHLRRAQREIGAEFGVVVVDYLQLMYSDRAGNEVRAVEVAEISRALKSIAKEFNVPVVALSQLNRGLENRPNKRPVMADLRESGSIEQDADVILFVYRDEVYNPDTPDRGTAEAIIAKQRNGALGTIRLTFNASATRFEDFISEH